MGTYYKAVQMDGTDFYSGTVDYAALCGTGRPLPELPGGRCCTGRVYHASTSAADTLIGGGWPCRLFLVEGEPVSEEENKRGFTTLRVLEELPAWQALGPNGEQVAALIEKIAPTTFQQAQFLSTAWDARKITSDTDRKAAWEAAGYEAENAARRAAWDAAGYAAWDAVPSVADDIGLLYPAVYVMRFAARYAARALVVKDLITEEQFDLLYGPWASIMEAGQA